MTTASHICLAMVAAGAVMTLTACNPDSGIALLSEPTLSARAGELGTLVVDNDRADCPHADFTSIQAAVLAAQSGDKILVCRGVYLESVLVEKADLRIEAQGAPGEVVLHAPPAQPYGFHLRNTTGVVLQGFRVEGYADANIIVEGGSGNTLRKNVATAGLFDGIEVKNSSANLIEHNISFENAGPMSDGIFVWTGASENAFRHNETFNNGQHGINLVGSGAGNVVFGNRSHHNRVRGIQSAQQSNGTLIENNDVFANGLVPVPSVPGVGVGISVLNSAEVTIRNNRSENNGTNGIGLNTTSRSVVNNNRAVSNRVVGIAVNGSSDNLVENNEVFRNGQDGIRILTNADRNIVRLNHVLDHSRDGIRVQDAASDGNTIEGNVIRQSDEHDAHDDSFGAGTGGTANFWLRNHCKTENRTGLCGSPVTPE
jgi:parallel beta-helix repeat protein